MKALYINAYEKTVTEIEIDQLDSLGQLQKLVGGRIEPAGSFENGDYVFVDEEGLLKNRQFFFEIEGFHQPFAGNGVLVGVNRDGENTDTETKLSELKKIVSFTTLAALKVRYQNEKE